MRRLRRLSVNISDSDNKDSVGRVTDKVGPCLDIKLGVNFCYTYGPLLFLKDEYKDSSYPVTSLMNPAAEQGHCVVQLSTSASSLVP